MALNFDYSSVENLEELKKDKDFQEKMDSCIWDTMHTGIPRITKANAGEFHRRQLMVRAALGNSYKELQEFHEWLPESFVESIAGLATNASTKTISAFNKDLLANIESRVWGIRNKGN